MLVCSMLCRHVLLVVSCHHVAVCPPLLDEHKGDKDYMKAHSKNKVPTILPQVFKDGAYLAVSTGGGGGGRGRGRGATAAEDACMCTLVLASSRVVHVCIMCVMPHAYASRPLRRSKRPTRRVNCSSCSDSRSNASHVASSHHHITPFHHV